jgi:hypothetical protein
MRIIGCRYEKVTDTTEEHRRKRAVMLLARSELVTPQIEISKYKTKTKLHGLSPRANYTDRATTACRRSDCQLLRIEGATWSA